jgi:acetyl-CoA hydrolase
MSAVQALYAARVTSAEDAVRRITSGMRVYLTGNCSVPQTLLAALVRRAPELWDVEIAQVLTIGPADYVGPEMAGHLRVNTLFISDNVRAAVNEGRADFTPVFLSEVPRLFKSGVLSVDVAMVHVSPPDEHGFCSFGIEVGMTKPIAQCAKVVIAEMNPRMPRTLGDSFIHLSKLDLVVPVDYPLPEVQMGATTETVQRIADHVAGLIPDGATLQTGIGAIPDAVLTRLENHKDLGIHTELFSDGIIDLINRGIITGERKTLHPGKVIGGFVLGTQRLYDFIHDNPVIELHPQDYVNDPFVIAQNARMVAINSAVEVDLTGQVCADSIGPRLYSGVGGQLDFVYGASRSHGGVPVIALPSTALGGKASRVVAMLKPGSGVTTSRNHIRFIVTEHGVADLYGKTVRQRARALIAIADPAFREDLERSAHDLRYL